MTEARFADDMLFASGEDPVLAAAQNLLRTPPPAVSEAQAADFAARHYGRTASVRLLTGERDRNFLLSGADGWQAILKFYNAVDDAPTRALQHGALLHVQSRDPACPVPRLFPTRSGEAEATDRIGALPVAAVLISRLPGINPVAADLSPRLRMNVGRVIGELATALADYAHPGVRRTILWDIMQVAHLRPLTALVAEPERRAALELWLDGFATDTMPLLRALPQQPIHNDLSLSNLLVDPDTRSNVVGVIDFGDIVHAPRINELAIAASYFLSPLDEPAQAIADILRGAAANLHLTTAEIAAMPALIRARLATRILLSGWRARLFPDNRDYILRSNRAAWLIWDRLQASPADLPARLVDLCAGARPG